MSRYQHVTFNESGAQLAGDSLVEFLKGHDKAITALEVIDQAVLARLPELKVIGKYGVGLDMIDMQAMRTHGKHLGWTGGVNRRSVSELVISFAIVMLRHVPAAHREVLSGTWRQHVGRNLTGRTVGIVGKDLVRMLQPFGCQILIHDILDLSDFHDVHGTHAVELDELLRRSDVVTLHVPLDESTRGMLGEQRLRLMKSDAILINAARGGLVDETALKKMLKGGDLGAAAFDVFSVEPPRDQELLALPNFLVTPHIGGSAEEAILAMGRAAIDGLDVHQIPGTAAE
jgi:D-3-phosphoglycerate dehydrogenase